jgi:zinc D-Ala-D-Ala carboxypeptidase
MRFFSTMSIGGLLIGAGLLLVGAYQSTIMRTQLSTLQNTVQELHATLSTLHTEQEKKDAYYVEELSKHAKTIDALAQYIEGFDSEVGELSGSVKTLEKLTTTDPELLQKYSKVYFLNEHYKPADLSIIKEMYDLVNGKEVSIHSDVAPFLDKLLEAATDDGIDIMVLSGYRSYTEQGTLKNGYTVRYGTGANQFSADQGYSEHQLGTAVDFTTKTAGENLASFKDSAAYAWLQEHAYQYGFVLSYPEGNSFYSYEPWHWRFVGKDLATHLHKKNLHFYDMEQREIDAYIPTLFDK